MPDRGERPGPPQGRSTNLSGAKPYYRSLALANTESVVTVVSSGRTGAGRGLHRKPENEFVTVRALSRVRSRHALVCTMIAARLL
eukprot:scaffold337_cov393-Prasinococcus_capsulatus_cf.AAC.18